MEIADENEYNAFYQSYENHPDFGEEYTNFLNKYSAIFNNEDLDRENLAALFFNNNDLSDDFKSNADTLHQELIELIAESNESLLDKLK